MCCGRAQNFWAPRSEHLLCPRIPRSRIHGNYVAEAWCQCGRNQPGGFLIDTYTYKYLKINNAKSQGGVDFHSLKIPMNRIRQIDWRLRSPRSPSNCIRWASSFLSHASRSTGFFFALAVNYLAWCVLRHSSTSRIVQSAILRDVPASLDDK